MKVFIDFFSNLPLLVEEVIEVGSHDSSAAEEAPINRIIDRFNSFFEDFSKGVKEGRIDPQSSWKLLSELEKELELTDKENSLVAMLAKAQEVQPGVSAFCFYLSIKLVNPDQSRLTVP